MGRIWSAGFILCFGLCFAWAANDKRYFQVGKSIELKPPSGTPAIVRVLWKHNGNLAAEWGTGDKEAEYYASFKGRARLDTSTGFLVIKNTTESDAGEYSLEINDKLLDDVSEFIVIQEVPKPDVWVRPGNTDDERKLNCRGDVSKAGPVTFLWDISEGEPYWVDFGRDVTLKKNDTTQRIKNLFCKMVNPAGEKTSEPRDNPFYPESSNGAYGALALLPIIAIAVLAVPAYIKREAIKKRLCPGGEGQPAGNGAISPAEVPLKENNQE